jgi:hypothetical protein
MSGKKKLGYLYGPVPKAVPAGLVLVHNSVRARGPRSRTLPFGFRCWLAVLTPRHERCDCGWCPHLRRHFRIMKVPQEAQR